MTDVKPHFSFWIIAVAGLVWNLMGCLNYIAQTDPDSVSKMPDVYQMIIAGRPTWATVAFAIAVFGGAVGCILLLLRKGVAELVLGLSLIGILVTSIFTVKIVGIVPSTVLSILVGGALLWYASIVQRSGVLK